MIRVAAEVEDVPLGDAQVFQELPGGVRGAARLAAVRGDDKTAAEWNDCADRLRERFEEMFWCEDLATYAIALDRDKQPCRVLTSNAGHCLFAGIASPAHARRVAETLMTERSFSGWGVRTVAAGEARYDALEARLAAVQSVAMPAITLEGDANGAPHPPAAAYARRFAGKYEHRALTGGIGHNLPQEAPEAFAAAVVEAANI